jgi:hypothetical protein
MALLNNKRFIMSPEKESLRRSSQTPATNKASIDNDANENSQNTAKEKAAKDAAEKAAKEKAALDAARKKSVQDAYTLLKREDGPETFIPIALEFAQKGTMAGLGQVWKVGITKTIRSAWSVGTGLKSSVGVFIDTLKKDTAVILREENFINTLRLENVNVAELCYMNRLLDAQHQILLWRYPVLLALLGHHQFFLAAAPEYSHHE